MTVKITFPPSAGAHLSTPWHLLFVGATPDEALEGAARYLARVRAPSGTTLQAVSQIFAPIAAP